MVATREVEQAVFIETAGPCKSSLYATLDGTKSLSFPRLTDHGPTASTSSGRDRRFLMRYELRPTPPNTPILPGNRSGSTPLSSRARQAVSRKMRCWGSNTSASRGVNPKNSASNLSAPGSAPKADTLWVPRPKNSSPVAPSNRVIVSLRDITISQNCESEVAPGTFTAIPTTAIFTPPEADPVGVSMSRARVSRHEVPISLRS